MKKVVVTGGAGFIGSNLAERLVERGYQVTIIDDLSTGRIENVKGLKGVEFVQDSVTNLPVLTKLFRGIEYVFHEAALARVPRSIEDPMTVNEVNIKGTLSVLLAAKENGVKKVVYASSSSVYGGAPTLPQREDMIPNPLSPYALTKLAGEYYCKIFPEIYQLPTVSLRYFNVYGPRQDPKSQYALVVPAFIDRISRGQPPVIHGDGEQTRDFTFVEDVVRANILAVESNAGGVYNIGSGKSISINRLAGTILTMMHKDLQPTYEKARPGDPRQTLADVSRARSFGYEPQWTLSEGLARTVAYLTARS